MPSQPFLHIDSKPSRIATVRSSRLGVNEQLSFSIGQYKSRVLVQPLNDVDVQIRMLLGSVKKAAWNA